MDLWTDIIGIDETPERREELLAAFETIAAEIRKLRGLDLTDIHPATVFDPMMADPPP
jgi:hypothetical protein